MDNTDKNTWYSGDWKQHNNDTIPYNGVKITATPNYTSPTSPPSKRKLTSVNATITDFTKDPNGVSNTIKLSRTGIWYEITIPDKTNVSPPEPNTDFTITGIYLNGDLGKLKLNVTTTGIYLQIQFRYGETNRTREELGFILQFDEYVED
ncbi:hypothetical protein [Tenacibaculum sp. 190524A02b]|uniref:Uncharacterized protein n=1 Tax=Tenacibaculum vairaonense TaxID=3137860 RepID=A0ABM9PNQ6_9FLAO